MTKQGLNNSFLRPQMTLEFLSPGGWPQHVPVQFVVPVGLLNSRSSKRRKEMPVGAEQLHHIFRFVSANRKYHGVIALQILLFEKIARKVGAPFSQS